MIYKNHPDTDCDGLTDGWEAITDLSINPYGPMNPTNRDSDNDGAIDGGESNVYPSTPTVIDNGSGRRKISKEGL